MRGGVALICTLLAVGCDPGHQFLVDLRSDLLPEFEVDEAEITIDTASGTMSATETITRDRDLIEGIRLAEFIGVPDGPLRATVRLSFGGALVVERTLAVTLTTDQVVTLLITRDCRGVVCSDAAGETCFGGVCGSNQCTAESSELCVSECSSDGDCAGSEIACAGTRCSLGVCIDVPEPDACAVDEFCDPDSGCLRLPEVDPCLMDPPDTHLAFGAGTEADPHVICTRRQLESLAGSPAADLGLAYELGQSIDVAGMTVSIGDDASPFRGTFDGHGFGITGLGRPLIGTLDMGTLREIELDGTIDNVDTMSSVGLAVARGLGGSLDAVTVRGSVTSIALDVGLLVGNSRLTISDCVAVLQSDVTAPANVGGLVGRQVGGVISSSTVTADPGVTVVASSDRAGGLVGLLSGGDVNGSHASVPVRVERYGGGLIGDAQGTVVVSRSSATGSVTGKIDPDCVYVAGLIGSGATLTVRESFATGDVQTGGGVVGGLVGWATSGTIEDCYATGNLSGGSVGAGTCSFVPVQVYVGGILGVSIGADVRRCWASGDALGTGPVRGPLVGLLFDSTASLVEDSFATGATGAGATEVGGLIGVVDANNTVTNSWWDITSTGRDVMCGRSNGTGCGAMTGIDTSLMPEYFFVRDNPPMDTWDFADVWVTREGDYPLFAWQR